MNQLDLILENIRLGQIEKLYQEAETDLEIIRGQRLINESVMVIRNILLQEKTSFEKHGKKIDKTIENTNNYIRDQIQKVKDNKGKLGVAAGAGAGVGAGASMMISGVMADKEDDINVKKLAKSALEEVSYGDHIYRDNTANGYYHTSAETDRQEVKSETNKWIDPTKEDNVYKEEKI